MYRCWDIHVLSGLIDTIMASFKDKVKNILRFQVSESCRACLCTNLSLFLPFNLSQRPRIQDEDDPGDIHSLQVNSAWKFAAFSFSNYPTKHKAVKIKL